MPRLVQNVASSPGSPAETGSRRPAARLLAGRSQGHRLVDAGRAHTPDLLISFFSARTPAGRSSPADGFAHPFLTGSVAPTSTLKRSTLDRQGGRGQGE